MKQVKVELSIDGQKISVDGEDLSKHVDFIGFQHDTNGRSRPVLTLGISAGVDLEGMADVELVMPITARQILQSFISSLDIEDFEARVVEREEMDTPHGFIASVFAQLLEDSDNAT